MFESLDQAAFNTKVLSRNHTINVVLVVPYFTVVYILHSPRLPVQTGRLLWRPSLALGIILAGLDTHVTSCNCFVNAFLRWAFFCKCF